MVFRRRCPRREDNRADGRGVIGASTMVDAVDWRVVVSSAVLAGVVSMLTSIAGLPEVSTSETEE